jgi:hypothetical protein
MRFVLAVRAMPAAPWVLSGASTAATWNNVIVGPLVVPLSVPR